MKKHILTLSLLACSCILFAQNENPFSQFGYEAPVMQVKEQPATNNDTIFIIENQNPNSDIRWLAIDTKNQLIRLYSAKGIEVGNENLQIYTTARWLVPDPAGQYYSPYMGMGNNWINRIDPNGMFSPIFDKTTGEYLGDDTQGYKGEPLYMDRDQYNNLTQNGKLVINHDWAITHLLKIDDLVYSQQGVDALSKSFTHIISRMNGMDISKLRNQLISIASYDWVNTKAYFSNCSKEDGIYVLALAFGDIIDGKSFVTAAFYTGHALETWSTVENIQNGLGIHEFKGHAILDLSDSDADHAIIFNMQKAHSTWANTTPAYKQTMIDLYGGQ